MVLLSTGIREFRKQTFLLFQIRTHLKCCRGLTTKQPRLASSVMCEILMVLFLKATLAKCCAATLMPRALWDTNSLLLPTWSTSISSLQCADKFPYLLMKAASLISPRLTLLHHYASKLFAHSRQWEFPLNTHSMKMHLASKK